MTDVDNEDVLPDLSSDEVSAVLGDIEMRPQNQVPKKTASPSEAKKLPCYVPKDASAAEAVDKVSRDTKVTGLHLNPTCN